jgi:hypothetical protein
VDLAEADFPVETPPKLTNNKEEEQLQQVDPYSPRRRIAECI